MTKIINQTGSIITVATALFLCLAGTARAIPTSTTHEVEINRNQIFNSPNTFLLFKPVFKPGAGEFRNFDRWYSHSDKPGLWTTSSSLTCHPPASSSVPDGGTTALMMAGAFGGLALLKKQLKS